MPRHAEYPYENESQAPGVESEAGEIETTEEYYLPEWEK